MICQLSLYEWLYCINDKFVSVIILYVICQDIKCQVNTKTPIKSFCLQIPYQTP